MGACAASGSPEGDKTKATAAGAEPAHSDPSIAPVVKRFRSARRYAVVGRPKRIRIPAIGVDSRLQPLGLNTDGTIEVPGDWHTAGWFEQGAKPGQRGPAVILGHVDSRTGPAVFYRLHELRPGDEIIVDQLGDSTATFEVKRTEYHDKDVFPTEAVYFPTLRPVLSLVTCGGAFDDAVGHYRSNVIVFASLVE